jgi:hypothetical protein
MASRQQEKERRRQARIAAEREAAAKAARDRRLRLFGGVAIALIAVAAAGIALALKPGGGSSASSGPAPKNTAAVAGPPIPARKVTDLSAAAKAAGCTLHSYKWTDNDRHHVADSVKVKYKTNPPTFGDHYQIPAHDGNYVGQGTPPAGNLVHALEHGRIEIQYRRGLPKRDVSRLETLFDEGIGPYQSGQYLLVFQNETKMPYDVAAAAWGHVLACPKFNDRVFDAIRAFRLQYTMKGPERSYIAPE